MACANNLIRDVKAQAIIVPYQYLSTLARIDFQEY